MVGYFVRDTAKKRKLLNLHHRPVEVFFFFYISQSRLLVFLFKLPLKHC